MNEVAYLPTDSFLPALESHIENNVQGGLLAWNIPWNKFLSIPGTRIVKPTTSKSYNDVVVPLRRAHLEAHSLCLDMGLFAKGAHNHIFLAHREGHAIPTGTHQGHDAHDELGAYEYKISIRGASNFNFNFGATKTDKENESLIAAKCGELTAAYCVTRSYARLNKIYKIRSSELLKLLISQARNTLGGQLTCGLEILT